MKIALLSCKNWPDVLEKERAFAEEFPKQFDVHVKVWNDPSVNWRDYNYLIFRTVWDYFEFPNEFETWLDDLGNQNIKTLNPLPIIKRNQHKFYLQDLERQGIDIIPTVFISKNTGLDLSFLKEKNWEKVVIKPAVSGGSYLTRLFSQSETAEIEAEYASYALENDLLVQPFMPEIQESGELSILFFQGKYSHAIVKKPKNGDFRVQSQFGGQYQIFEPDAVLLTTAKQVIKTFGGDLLYARVDGILKNGKFLLMELELIEPDLYFDHHPEAKKNFLAALEAMVMAEV
jgi:glutathione synthase/RimK-type ligase-like ATP-grasp enzyme